MQKKAPLVLILTGLLALPLVAGDTVRIRGDFPRGSAGSLRYVGDGRVAGQTMHWIKSDGIGNQYYWFYFQIENVKGRQITFELNNLIGVYRGNPHELYSTNARPAYSYDNETWQRVTEATYTSERKQLTFRIQFEQDVAWVAFAHPFLPKRLNGLLADAERSGLAAVRPIGESAAGNQLQMVSIQGGGGRRPQCLIIAGQHSGEDAAPMIAEGLLRGLMADTALARAIRERVDFHVVPLMNPDGYWAGVSRYTETMEDLNAEWADEEGETEPEVRAIRSWIDQEFRAGRGIDLFLDLHCYGQRQERMTMQSPEDVLVPLCKSIENFWPIVPKPKNKYGSARWYLYDRYQTPAGTMEATQSRLAGQEYLTPEDYNRMGWELAQAIDHYLQRLR